FREFDLSSVEYIIWSGAAAPEPLLEVLATFDATLATSYGMTETVGSVTYTDLDAGFEVLANTIGKPDPRYEVKVMRPDGTESEVGEEGEIWVRGDCRMLGYFNREDATKETIDPDGWLHTGDLAFMRPDGNLTLVGRLSEMYKSGGYNVYPREVEMVLEDHEALVLAAVVGVPDPLYREVGFAFVQAQPGASVDLDGLRAYCRTRLANYKVPKHFEVIEEMPFLPVGKIDKLRLAEMARDRVAE
ncbi:MAG: AMP-binding protein, partial [Acidimicrobiia bacterium]|nr:AMP-binding protein [Acidimicrobiia bacterium]